VLAGADQTVKWFPGSRVVIQTPWFMTGPVFQCTANDTTLSGCTISSPSPGQVQPAVTCTGTGNTCSRLEVANLGGITYNGASRFVCEDCVVQGYTGLYGFNLTNASIGFLMRCNAAPGGNNPPGAGTTSYYLLGGGSLNVMNCEANGSPDYALQLLNSSDNEFYDFEANGANVTQIFVQAGNDNVFVRPYVFQSAPTGLHIKDASLVQVLGGRIGGATGTTVMIEASSRGSSQEIFLVGVSLSAASGQTGGMLNVSGGVLMTQVIGCGFNAHGIAPYCVVWDDTYGPATSAIVGCVFWAPHIAPILLTVNNDPSLALLGNAGLNPVGSITPPASPLVSGTVYQNTSGVLVTIYQPAYATTSGTAGTVAVALGPTSTPPTIFTKQIPGTTSSSAPDMVEVRVPPGWYYAFTASGATLATATFIGE